MKDLSDPERPLTKLILFLYSMETYLYNQINLGSRIKDKTKIQTLGPYSFVLSWIVQRS
jgi:hypothetical protein